MTDKTDIELMHQALEVLVQHVKHYDYEQFTSMCELEPAKDLILALRERLAQPEQRPLINPPACTWTHDNDEGSWDAECGERWSITEGTPEENNFRFCPGCGRLVKTILPASAKWSGE